MIYIRSQEHISNKLHVNLQMNTQNKEHVLTDSTDIQVVHLVPYLWPVSLDLYSLVALCAAHWLDELKEE